MTSPRGARVLALHRIDRGNDLCLLICDARRGMRMIDAWSSATHGANPVCVAFTTDPDMPSMWNVVVPSALREARVDMTGCGGGNCVSRNFTRSPVTLTHPEANMLVHLIAACIESLSASHLLPVDLVRLCITCKALKGDLYDPSGVVMCTLMTTLGRLPGSRSLPSG